MKLFFVGVQAIDRPQLSVLLLIALIVAPASGVQILYEPFNYTTAAVVSDNVPQPNTNFLSTTNVGTANTGNGTYNGGTVGFGPSGFPKGQLAPNNNSWYGVGILAATGYQYANDAQVAANDLTVAGLAKPGTSNALSLGGTGHSFRLSLDTATTPDQLGQPNATDTADPLAGTDGTLQASDTDGTGYYSLALKVTDITSLNATGGVLLGFNNFAWSQQNSNPATVGAGLTIRPKAGGGAGDFELGIVKQGASNFANATWGAATYTTGSTIFVVGKYQTVGARGNPVPAETDDIASLWINPPSSTFGGFDPTSPAPLTNTSGNDVPSNVTTENHTLHSFILRQNGTATNNQIPLGIIYDELRVGTNYADVTPLAGTAGDYNGDNKVDAADYVAWRLDPEGHGGDPGGYNAWRSAFNAPSSGLGIGAGVPEPSFVAILLVGVALIGTVYRRSHRETSAPTGAHHVAFVKFREMDYL